MGIGKLGRKVMWLLQKISNPPYFLYLLCHYAQVNMPKFLAKSIARKNLRSFLAEEQEFYLETYDGSNQAVHPDVAYFNGEYWLAATPYPYGMEEYENPCLYRGGSIATLKAIPGNPIAKQRRHKIGFHLSDPCLLTCANKLICVYRENTRENGIEQNYLYAKVITGKEKQEIPSLIVSSKDDPLLSPALVCITEDGIEKIHMYHVRRSGNRSEIVHSALNEELKAECVEEHICKGLPEDYFIWHISIAFSLDKKKFSEKENAELSGLFLLKRANSTEEYRLFLAEQKNKTEWNLRKEIRPSANIRDDEVCPYKASFIPHTDEVLYSYIDKENRYRMTIIHNGIT